MSKDEVVLHLSDGLDRVLPADLIRYSHHMLMRRVSFAFIVVSCLMACADPPVEPNIMFVDSGLGNMQNQPGQADSMDVMSPNGNTEVDVPDGLRGTPCDPNASDTGCTTFCAPLGRGSALGECAEPCAGPDDQSCSPPYVCNTLLRGGQVQNVCLPNRACGGLDYYGYCQGDTLFHCGYAGQERTDCRAQGQICGEISFELGYDCIAEEYSGGCGQIPTTGMCDGSVLRYCESQESGRIKRQDCRTQGLVCLVQGGRAQCASDEGPLCGDIGPDGVCEGDVVVACDPLTGDLERTPCGPGQTCSQSPSIRGAFCAQARPQPMGNEVTIRGRALYQKRALSTNGYSAPRNEPIAYAAVLILDNDQALVAEGYTDAGGQFEVIMPRGGGDYFVAIAAGANHERHALSVLDCPQQEDVSQCNIYAVVSPTFRTEENVNHGDLVATVESGMAGAFNIFMTGIRTFDFVRSRYGQSPPPLRIAWAPGSNTLCQTSCYSSFSNTVYVLGTPQDTDEFDDAVLFHEYGHFVESNFSRSDTPGGFHDGSPTDPRLAWGEGYGTYFGAELANNAIYLDGGAGGVSRTDVNNAYTADLNDPRGMRQPVSEYMVMAILWKLSRGGDGVGAFGVDTIFDVMPNYLRSNALQDRGVTGVDLVDFIDGLRCRGQNVDQVVAQLLRGTHRFPYENGGPANCR